MMIRLSCITIQQIHPAGKRYLPLFACPRTSCPRSACPVSLGVRGGGWDSAAHNSFSRGLDKLEHLFYVYGALR